MHVEQLYTNCLSEAAYLIVSNGEAAVIDPLRDCSTYVELAGSKNAKIKYVFETHFHADFISGHLDLSKITGAPIIYGPETKTNFPVRITEDGERIKIGEVEIEVLHTPGHTPESTCYLLYDEQKKPYCIFTGDTLFVGDVGRPDLFGSTISKEELAARMFDSLQRLKQLPDEVIVYPAHGPGSSCGKNLGKETWSTMGQQKMSNYALQEMSQDDFIVAITSGLTAPPQYFPLNAKINREGYSTLEDVIRKSMIALDADAFEKEMTKPDTIVIDTRHQDQFETGFIPGSVFVGLKGRFAEWVGTIFKMTHRFLLVTDPGREEETIVRMARVGYENVAGFLKGGFDTWKNSGKEFDMLISIEPDELLLDRKFSDITIVDVRKESEYETVGHVEGALNAVLQSFETEIEKLPKEKETPLYLYCEGGYRSVIAASLLKRKGYQNLRNVRGGYNAISKTTNTVEAQKFSAS